VFNRVFFVKDFIEVEVLAAAVLPKSRETPPLTNAIPIMMVIMMLATAAELAAKDSSELELEESAIVSN
tara:strand:+ start:736 stop:942 length:207 start_codon:yes stop_codon:yes gene_type:complete